MYSTARADVRGIRNADCSVGGWGTEGKEQGTLLEGGKPREEDTSRGGFTEEEAYAFLQ